MKTLRLLVRERIVAAWVLIALTLVMKLVVPVGFMPSFGAGGVSIVVCSGMGPAAMTMPGAMSMPGEMPGHDRHEAPAKPEIPCLGAGVGATILDGGAGFALALPLAPPLVLTLLLAAAFPTRRTANLRPHLRGPPLTA